jgi:hypothetical protein
MGKRTAFRVDQTRQKVVDLHTANLCGGHLTCGGRLESGSWSLVFQVAISRFLGAPWRYIGLPIPQCTSADQDPVHLPPPWRSCVTKHI